MKRGKIACECNPPKLVSSLLLMIINNNKHVRTELIFVRFFGILSAQQSWVFFDILFVTFQWVKCYDCRESIVQQFSTCAVVLLCSLSLSCGNKQSLPWKTHPLDWSIHCSKTFAYILVWIVRFHHPFYAAISDALWTVRVTWPLSSLV